MKRPKSLTRDQAEIVSVHHLNPKEWFFVKETDFHIKVINRDMVHFRYLDKFISKKVGNRCILKEELIVL